MRPSTRIGFHPFSGSIRRMGIWPVLFMSLLFAQVASAQKQATVEPFANLTKAEKAKLKSVVDVAFRVAHDGFSSDELLLNDRLRNTFVKECQKHAAFASEYQANWMLLNLRKAGGLSSKSTKRAKSRELGEYLPLAESIARSIQDEHLISTDKLIANPVYRNQFDRLIRSIDKEADLYAYRKSVFQLRKTRRLRPELIVRVADWNKQVIRTTVEQLQDEIKLVPENPGVYLFFDKKGYLYIGEAKNLRTRLAQHVDESDRKSLANYFQRNELSKIKVEIHTFDKNSAGAKVAPRRAYESELIRTRKPRLNIRP